MPERKPLIPSVHAVIVAPGNDKVIALQVVSYIEYPDKIYFLI